VEGVMRRRRWRCVCQSCVCQRAVLNVEREFGELHEPPGELGRRVNVILQFSQRAAVGLEGKVAPLHVRAKDTLYPFCLLVQ
jgi:hypothetical protein